MLNPFKAKVVLFRLSIGSLRHFLDVLPGLNDALACNMPRDNSDFLVCTTFKLEETIVCGIRLLLCIAPTTHRFPPYCCLFCREMDSPNPSPTSIIGLMCTSASTTVSVFHVQTDGLEASLFLLGGDGTHGKASPWIF